MRDTLYANVPFQLNEMAHHYGANVHLVGNPFLLSQLATLCAKGTLQPQINRLVEQLYTDLVKTVINAEFPRKMVTLPTRMIDSTPLGIYQGEVVDPQLRVVTVNIARAGTLPSQVTYDLLNFTVDPSLVRQDHIIMSRMIDAAQAVVGSEIGGAKIGGDVDDAFVLFPDPMGATGGSLSTAIQLYKTKVPGRARRIITLNLIVTPEYLRRMTTEHPDVIIYALRLDRGLSPPEVFGTAPGLLWDKERGLDDRQYIVPGGGGFGEIMNNAYV
ncbi:uracil phosphoribosyltransferase [Corallococcus sp. RDP092CA]|uniref:uracil phosphoribosyltransferase n=1 Tax=Corallococcus sp. RDP092CA TaxID=3109369 RepID=UPI0035AEC5A8